MVGSVSAIGAPVAWAVRSSGTPAVSELQLAKCDPTTLNNLENVVYGSGAYQNVCWDLVNRENSSSDEASLEYSKLFKAGWEQFAQSGQNWQLATPEAWTDQCMYDGITAPWIVFNSEDGARYLGVCDNSEPSNTKFVKWVDAVRSAEGKQSPKFWTCETDCWITSIQQDGKTILKDEKIDKWREITFYSKKAV
ncbi:hypothetical protein [Candidatus Mycoplasma haematominutum]|uniref:hypothetical protein n=1 Tax=Candidatus Mycoplasma haematominutum TaxID=209446 RepID=UPI0011B7F746|nr:hypothetical protein [Candidatus Mycoplasma haematominutum]